jgi:putative ABC transport system substrate-binding protein
MRRRRFLGLTAAALASLAPAALARGASPPRIGWLWQGRSTINPDEVNGFRQGLRDLGYVEGQNILVEYRFGEGSEEGLKKLAAELVGLRVDVLVEIGPPALRALRDTGTTIPIVAAAGHIVENAARPNGTITGIDSYLAVTLDGKRLDFLKQAVPAINQVGFLFNPKYGDLSEIEQAAATLRVVLHSSHAQLLDEIEPAIARLKKDGVQAMVVGVTPPLFAYQKEIANLALKFHLPAIAEQPEFVEYGGLLSYGVSIFDIARRQAYYVDRILKGAKPADLPVEQLTKFELLVNLKTAKALGFTVPESLVLQADKVIE